METRQYWNHIPYITKPYIPEQCYHVRFSIQPQRQNKYDLRSWFKTLVEIEDFIAGQLASDNITNYLYRGVTHDGFEILLNHSIKGGYRSSLPIVSNGKKPIFTTDFYFVSPSQNSEEEIATALNEIRCLLFADGLKMVHWVIHNSS